MAERVNFDVWRANYKTMSFADHQEFNAECLRLYPEQRSWDAKACANFLAKYEPSSVVELGGWDGALADLMLREFPIDRWCNYDITPGVPSACDDPRFSTVVLDDWPWRQKVEADVLIASHVFEHMRMYEIDLLLTEWRVGAVFVDCPIGLSMRSWRGYDGSHILEVGSREFLSRCLQIGYSTAIVDATDERMVAHLERMF